MSTQSFHDDEQQQVKFQLKAWKKVAKYAFQRPFLILIILITIGFTAYFDSTLQPFFQKSAIDALIQGNGVDEISISFPFGLTLLLDFFNYAVLFFSLLIIRSVAIFLSFFSINYIEMSIMLSIRRDAYHKVQHLSFSYFDKTPSGWLISRLENDASKIGDILSWGTIQILWVTYEIVFILWSMFFLNSTLAWLVTITVPFVVIITPFFQLKILRLNRLVRNTFSSFATFLSEGINGAKTIKSLAIEDHIQSEGYEIASELYHRNMRVNLLSTFFHPLIYLIGVGATTLVLYFGMDLFQGDKAMVGTVAAFIGYSTALYGPIQGLTEAFTEFMNSQASVEKVISLIETPEQVKDTPEVIAKYGTLTEPKTEAWEPLKGDIEFSNVTFGYTPSTLILPNLNLSIRQGESIAIVGETGSGKSTLVNLLCRFYEPNEGKVLIDGTDYRERSIGWLRSHIGYVQQTPYVFSSTIKDNIRYGRLDATDEEIEEICRQMGADDFIRRLPKGYDTMLDEGGNSLSTGQKQLLSFARAMIRNPAIMILDEATSSIDTETEKIIQTAVSKTLKGRTSLIIAHRLSTIVEADRILVLHQGKIVEDGNHPTLMKLKGNYYHLYMNQFKELNLDSMLEQQNNL